MGKVLGVVAEYNPFHNGHLYHLNKSKEICNADAVVCVMSGNFTQRGDTSIIDKWAKAEMALSSGVDLVIELPSVYAVSSAEHFAYGSVRILDSLKIVDNISFGSECGDLSVLNEFAEILHNEPKEYTTLLSHELSKGISYPRARENALMMYLNDVRKYANILSDPNNILGIEYLKAIKKLKSSIVPVTIERSSVAYNSTETNNNFASSTGIRKLLCNNKDIKKYVPLQTYKIMEKHMKYGQIVQDISAFEKEILYTFRRMTTSEIASLPDVSEGLEERIKNAANTSSNLADFVSKIKTKRYTLTRIQRILLYALLVITKEHVELANKTVPYIRILGMTKKGKQLLSEIKKKNPKLKVITSVKDFVESNKNKTYEELLEIDIFATNVYTLAYEYEPLANLDYTKKLITN